MEWTHVSTDRYLAIGKLVSGQRFRREFSNPYHVAAINLYDGRVYLLREGKRILLKRVTS